MSSLIIRSSDFADALTVLSVIVPKRHPKPAVQCILIEATRECVTIRGNDLECSASFTITPDRFEIDGDRFAALLPIDRLQSIVKSSKSDGPIHFKSSATAVEVFTGASSANLVSLAPADYPPHPEPIPAGRSVTLATLRRLLNQVVSHVSTENGRYAFNQIRLELIAGHGEVRAVATDGRRLAVAHTIGVNARPIPRQDALIAMLPARFVKMLNKAYPKPTARKPLNGSATIAVHNVEDLNYIHFTAGPWHIVSTVDASLQFPSYDEVIPREHNHCLTVDSVPALIDEIRAASVAINEESKGLMIELDRPRGLARFASWNPAAGLCQVTSTATTDMQTAIAGLRIGINPNFLREALESFKMGDCPRPEITFTAPNRPIKIEGIGLTCVIMPVNTDQQAWAALDNPSKALAPADSPEPAPSAPDAAPEGADRSSSTTPDSSQPVKIETPEPAPKKITLAAIRRMFEPGQQWDVTNHYIHRVDHPTYGTTRRTIIDVNDSRFTFSIEGSSKIFAVDWPLARNVKMIGDKIEFYGNPTDGGLWATLVKVVASESGSTPPTPDSSTSDAATPRPTVEPAPTPSDAAKPRPTTSPARAQRQPKRPASQSTWAWRHKFYDFRRARRIVQTGRNIERLGELVNGQHANYVQRRLIDLARSNPTVASRLADAGVKID